GRFVLRQVVRGQVDLGAVRGIRDRRQLARRGESLIRDLRDRALAVLFGQHRVRALAVGLGGATAPIGLLVGVIEVQVLVVARVVDHVVVLVAHVIDRRLVVVGAVVVRLLGVLGPAGVVLPTRVRVGPQGPRIAGGAQGENAGQAGE